MKNAILLAIMLFSLATSANISKVFVCAENESFSTTPVHGTTSWTTYIGTSKLAFARGYTYKMKIEYSGLIPPGTIATNNNFASVNSVERSGNTFTFKIVIFSTSDRLSTFQVGFRKTGTFINYPIACEVVEIGKLYSMTLQDSTNTTMVAFAAKSQTLASLQFAKQTGKKYFRFYGSDLGNIRHNSSLTGGQAMGLLFNASSFALVDNTNFKLNATAGTVSATGGKLADHILGRLIDTAADKHYPWVTYKYAARMDGGITNTSGTIPSGGAISGTAISFSLLPNQIVILPSTTSGYHDFMSATYTVN
jgi:hypothetical protein